MEPKVVIEFDNPSKTYEPSGLVVGRVIIISSGQDGLHLTEVIIRLEGKRVAFANPDKPEEFYFCERQLVLINTETILPPDELIDLAFEFKLPEKLPSSFHVSRGLVDYSIVVKLRRKFDFDITHRSTFFVNGVLLLNAGDSSAVEIHSSKPAGCCSCFNWRKGHRFGLMLKLSKDQFLPGEGIDYTVKIWNSSEATLKNCKIELIRELRLLDCGNFDTVLKEYGQLSSIIGPVIKPGEKLCWTSIRPQEAEDPANLTRNKVSCLKSSIPIPGDTPPSHLGCRAVVQLDYFVKISMKTDGFFCPISLDCKCPIIIGSDHSQIHESSQ